MIRRVCTTDALNGERIRIAKALIHCDGGRESVGEAGVVARSERPAAVPFMATDSVSNSVAVGAMRAGRYMIACLV